MFRARAMWAAISALIVGGISAQEAPAWTSEEAAVPGFLRGIAQSGACEQRGAMLWLINEHTWNNLLAFGTWSGGIQVDFGGYRYRFHSLAAQTVPEGAGPGWLLYAYPIVRGSGSHHAFALSDRGEVMWTDNQLARYGEDNAEPEWTAVLASGGSETIGNALTMPGKAMDGQIWLPLDMKRPRSHVLHLGSPLLRDGKVTVAVGPKSWLRSGTAIGAPFPAGISAPDERGNVTLRGIARPNYYVSVLVKNRSLELVPVLTQLRDGVLELTVDETGLAAARMDANELSAITTLKNLNSAQQQFRASGAVDCNGDGNPEYGFLGEMSGTTSLRSDGQGGLSDRRVRPPILSRAFSRLENSRIVRKGYVFQVFLPDGNGEWLAEAPTGGAEGIAVDPGAAGAHWCAYAWPAEQGATGRRVFFINETGEVLAADNADGRYSGHDKPIPSGAAFVNGKISGAAVANRCWAGRGCSLVTTARTTATAIALACATNY